MCRLDEEDEEEEDADTEAPLKQQQNGATADDLWVPVALGLGLPLMPDKLCIAVCGRAGASNFLDVRQIHRHIHNTGRVLMLARCQTESRTELALVALLHAASHSSESTVWRRVCSSNKFSLPLWLTGQVMS